MFEKSKVIPRKMILRGLERAAMPCVTVGDPVKIISGELRGALGNIKSLSDREANVKIQDEDVTVSIPLEALRKDMRIGDEVLVTGGALIGLTGWVVSVDGEALQIYVRKLAKQFSVISHQVICYKGVIKSSTDSETVLVELQATMKQEAIPFKNLRFL
ncbi:hypothetical protein H0H81_007006 [Sphagnurus paluster]|uniref:KOW domain-containing protein n=1 Tax=Sphagnurus paluster TaxID=117069 RepID=A0A9P7K1X1_9AGAR|nr:hypothetical protein H0H81_007006 [Sphagnurus paluster]